MIHVVFTPNWAEAWRRQKHRVAFSRDLGVSGAIFQATGETPAGLTVWRNGALVEDVGAEPVAPGDWIHAVRIPEDAQLYWRVALLFIAGLAAKALAPTLPGPLEQDDQGPTYTLSGGSSSRVEGRAIPLVYGKIRAFGQVVNEAIENEQNISSHSVYKVQLSFGEGPIYAIGDRTTDTPKLSPLGTGSQTSGLPTGILVEGNSAENLDNLEAHIRLGSNEQEPAFGFEFVETRNEVGSALDQSGTTDLQPDVPIIVIGSTSQTDQDTQWDTYGVTYDLTADSYDAVRFTVQLPQGYYAISGSNQVLSMPLWHAIRYIELDGAGTPITTGGNFSDGYVRLPETRHAYKSQSPFSVDYVVPLYNPATYTPIDLGYSVDLNGGGTDDVFVTTSNVPNAWTPTGTPIDVMTVELWCEIDDLDASGTGSTFNSLMDAFESTVGGFRFAVRNRTYQVAPGFTENYWVPTVELAAPFTRIFENVDPNDDSQGIGAPSFVIADGERNFLCFTYASDVDGIANNDRIRLFANGEMIWEQYGDLDLEAPTASGATWTTDVHFGRDPTESRSMDGRLDEVWVYHSERSPQVIFNDYAQGDGQYGQDSNNLVFGYHCDEGDGTSATPLDDFSSFGNDATLAGTANTAGAGMVANVSDNKAKRSTYRVEILRNNQVSTSAQAINVAELEAVTGIIDEAFSYPGSPILSLEVQASEQLSTSIPSVSAVVSGRFCPVWTGQDAENPTFIKRWTRNPAWICADVILDKVTGLGQEFGPKDVDVLSLQEFADHCDEIVKDHRGDTKGNHDAVTQGDEAGDADGWLNMIYDATTVDPLTGEVRGSIQITWTGSTLKGVVPAHWAVGKAVRWSGMQVDDSAHAASILVDTNYPNIAGYEIKSITTTGGVTNVVVYWDNLALGAPWAGGGNLRTALGAEAPTGVLEGAERRFLYDAVHDVSEGAWDALLSIAATARAAPMIEGSRIRFRLNKARTPIGFVGMGNIIPDTFEVEFGDDARTNAMTVEFLDEDLNYERSTEYDEHPSIQNSASLDEVRVESLFARGIVRRSQAHRHARYELNVRNLLKRSGSWKAGPDHVSYEVGDLVYVGHDIVDWGLSGRVYADSSNDDEIALDREVSATFGTTYYVRARNSVSGAYETAQVDVPSGGATYAAGDTISLLSSFSFTPRKGDTFLWYEDGEEFIADIVDIQLGEDLSVEVDWVEYDVAVYNDDFGSLSNVPAAGNHPVNLDNNVIPPDVLEPSVVEAVPRNQSGAEVPHVDVSWSRNAAAARRTARVGIWVKTGADELFRKAAEVDGAETFASIPVAGGETGDAVVVAVQPIAHGGARLTPERCLQARCTLLLAGRYPAAPTNFSARLDGDEAVYSWTTASGAESYAHEIRRGGWVLGQLVGVAPPGVSELRTMNWAGGAANVAGVSDPTLYLRARSPAGRYSSEPATLVFSPDYVNAATREEGFGTPAGGLFFADQSWEDYRDGWIDDGVYTPDGTLTDLQRNADGFLEFTGSSTLGYYETAPPVEQTGWIPERYFVEAHAVAYQLHPVTWAALPWGWGDHLVERMTWEGPIDSLPGETGSCSLKIQIAIRADKDSAFGSWTDFAPGIYHGLTFKFRLEVTRPDTTYDVSIERFHTRFRRIPRQRWERSPQNLLGYARLLG